MRHGRFAALRSWPAFLGGLMLTAVAAGAGDPRITVDVDPRVELMSIIFRLAGNAEYNQPDRPRPTPTRSRLISAGSETTPW